MKKPSIKAAAGAVKRIAVAVAKGSKVFVSNVMKQQRIATCQKCPEYFPASDQCGVCGCVVRAKASLATEKCPRHRWPLTNV